MGNITSIQSNPVPVVVGIDGLADYLSISKDTALRIWQRLPHLRVTSGTTAKGARFVIQDVIDHLRRHGGNYERLAGAERPAEGSVDVQVSSERPEPPPRELPHQARGTGGRIRAAAAPRKPEAGNADKYGILRAV